MYNVTTTFSSEFRLSYFIIPDLKSLTQIMFERRLFFSAQNNRIRLIYIVPCFCLLVHHSKFILKTKCDCPVQIKISNDLWFKHILFHNRVCENSQEFFQEQNTLL